MRRYTYIYIAIILLCLLSLPTKASDGLRSASVATLSPSWQFFSFLKNSFIKLTAVLPTGGYTLSPEVKRELEMLRLENHNLRSQVEFLKAQVDLEKLIGQQAEFLKQFPHDDAFSKRRKAEICRLIELYSPSLVAKPIFREAASWSSSLWINVGEKTNQALGKIVIGKNSPVVVGTSIVGVVEYVGDRRSRVRLITDATIVPSVRAIRDNQTFLAKGELKGVREVFFRSKQAVLQGVGFNCDFDDEEGSSRDLRLGNIIKPGDLLITTGMDGVFPPGFRVAVVSKVYPLSEGSTSYEIDAAPCVRNFDDLTFVSVLPPLE